jgi:DNA mismatch repair protein MutL
VRFRHGSLVHDFVRDTIRERLMVERPASRIPMQSPPQPGAALPYSEFSQRVENMTFDSITPEMSQAGFPGAEGNLAGNLATLPEFTLHRPPSPLPRFDFSDAPRPAVAAVPDTHGPLFDGAALPDLQSLESLTDLRPLGQIHDSFIIAAGRDGLWIIDQHVAHERILFEQVLAAREKGHAETQRLLVPLVIGLSAAQQIEYARIAEELDGLGFETEPFGNRTIAIKSAPAGIGAADVERVLFEILEIAETELRKASLDDLRRSMAASIACRAAIKINMRLEPEKIDWLLRALAATSCPMSCPHGRPIALRYSTRDILKSFHRI